MTVDSLLKEAYCESDFDSVEGLGAWFDPANPESLSAYLEETKATMPEELKTYKDEDAEVVEGIFDGYYMVGADQKKYPVPMNYSSKSKLVPGDVMKLKILPEGKLVFTISTNLGAEGKAVEITNGKGTYNYKVPEDATDGTSYTVTAKSEETDVYNAGEGTGYVDVVQVKTTTTISSASGAPGETVTLDVEVTAEDGSSVNGEVVVTCPDGSKVTVTISDGKGQFDWTIPEDAKDGDEYQFTATFEGNSTYLGSNGTGTVTVEEPEEEPEPEPEEPEEDEPVPEEPEVVPAKMLNTGNPLVALLAAFVLIGLGLKRREEE